MTTENHNKAMDLMLLREDIWKLEDKLNVILESQADQEAGLIRAKRLADLCINRLSRLEERISKPEQEEENDRQQHP